MVNEADLWIKCTAVTVSYGSDCPLWIPIQLHFSPIWSLVSLSPPSSPTQTKKKIPFRV